jgi:tripartite-type tricarboxylate transporter receptor subunit TctC
MEFQPDKARKNRGGAEMSTVRVMSSKTLMVILILSLVGLVLAGVGRAAESAWPKRDVVIIVPYNPGGGYDITARVLAPLLAKYLPNNVSVIVQNVPGAGGKIGTLQTLNAKPDGYTLGIQDPLPIAIMSKEGDLGSVPPDSITYLFQLDAAPSVVVVRSDGPYQTVGDMKGKNVRFGVTTDNTMGTNALANALGAKETFITYNGVPEACMAVARGDADCTWSIAGTVKRQISSLGGKLKPALIIGGDRDPSLPDVPTAREMGLNLEEEAFIFRHVLVGPPKIPEEVKKVLNEALDKAMRDPQLAPQMAKVGYPAVPVLGGDLKKLVEEAIKVVEKYEKFLPKK